MATTGSTPPAAEAGLRERKKQRTRETIARVALDLFARQGFQATTIRQIADAAEVAPRTVSAYFPAKEDLVFDGYEETFVELARRLDGRRPGESASDALGAWLRDTLQRLDGVELERGRCVREIVETDDGLRAYERGLQERAERLIASAVAVDLGVPEDDLLPHMVGSAAVAALDALGRAIKDASRDSLGDEAFALIDDAMTFIGAGVDGLLRAGRFDRGDGGHAEAMESERRNPDVHPRPGDATPAEDGSDYTDLGPTADDVDQEPVEKTDADREPGHGKS